VNVSRTAPHDDAPGRARPRPTGTGLRRGALPFTPAVEDYTKALYRLERHDDAPVATGALAARLDVSAPSASNMLRHLGQLGLVTVTAGRGARLTPEGRTLARTVIRRHRIIECFLMDALHLPWDSVHAEADLLEHAVSDRVAEAMWDALGRPDRDPHGDPITDPAAAADPDDDLLEALDACEANAAGILVRVSDAQPEALRYMASRGIAPGMPVRVIAREPFGAGLRVRIGESEHIIGSELARLIFIERTR
jgi:DtxR family transcriptional regulator, Mn-dependent transcriptional regulator